MAKSSKRELAIQLIHKARKLIDSENQRKEHSFEKIQSLFLYFLDQCLPDEEVYLSTYFSQLSYLGAQKSWHWKDKFLSQKFRRIAESYEIVQDQNAATTLGVYVLIFLGYSIYAIADDTESILQLRDGLFEKFGESSEKIDFIATTQVVVLGYDQESQKFNVTSEQFSDQEWHLDLENPSYSDYYKYTTNYLKSQQLYPISASLIDVDILSEKVFTPRQIVIEPDFLFNVTEIASCFSGRSIHTLQSFVNRFLPQTSSLALLLGNISNYFLDRLLTDDSLEYRKLFKETFALYPLQYACISDEDLLKLYQRAQVHFNTLRNFVITGLRNLGLKTHNCYIEPSFYSGIYGLSGRLDLLGEDPKRPKSPVIIELKSGSPFMANKHRIGQSHYIQTLLYDLLIRSKSNQQQKARNFILYSGEREMPLRSAPGVREQQKEALEVRNKLYFIERELMSKKRTDDLLHWTGSESRNGLMGFLARNVSDFHAVIKSLDPIEYTYFREFTSFITREFHQKKIGFHMNSMRRSDASLWRENVQVKESRFEILAGLEIVHEDIANDDHILHLEATERTAPLANFRNGDIVILYPSTGDSSTALEHQLFKGNLIEIKEGKYKVRLRNPQVQKGYFQRYTSWHIEGDSLDSSYRRIYQSLYEWAKSPKDQRQKLMGYQAPRIGSHLDQNWPDYITEHQKKVLDGLTRIRDYGLVWGPPGTGKTSVILRNYVQYFVLNIQKNLLICGYTNRSVDEISAQLEDLGIDYLRIGSRYSVGEQYRHRLLQYEIENLQNRSEILRILDTKKVIVGTLSSFLGKPELFDLKTFDTVLIDEASQILEASLIGFLTRFDRFILFGDHKQLPAVVLQKRESTTFADKGLKERGFVNQSDSLFERLLLQAEKYNYDAVHVLHEQGRMHEEIMSFCNEHFYDNILKTITSRQSKALETPGKHCLPCLQRRVAFVSISGKENESLGKNNTMEALYIIELITSLTEDLGIAANSIGVICPFRAQVALVMNLLEQSSIPHKDSIVVDTVERFQGGAKDVIILSLTIQNSNQIKQIKSLSSDGRTDRKFNVAITRARERLYILGDKKALNKDPILGSFIRQYDTPRYADQASNSSQYSKTKLLKKDILNSG